jgi:ATP-binding cassette subfamily B protein RaxB
MVRRRRCVGILVIVSAVLIVNSSKIFFPRSAAQRMADSYAAGEFLGNDGVVLQSSYNDCAPAALQMVLCRYGIPGTVDELTRRLRPGGNGSTILAVRDLAESKGLHAEGWRLTLSDFLTVQFPVILFLHNDHFVVADSVNSDMVFLSDPAIGRVKLPVLELSRIWKGETLIFRKK